MSGFILIEGFREAGRHQLSWDGGRNGEELASGVYFIRLDIDGETWTQKAVLRR